SSRSTSRSTRNSCSTGDGWIAAASNAAARPLAHCFRLNTRKSRLSPGWVEQSVGRGSPPPQQQTVRRSPLYWSTPGRGLPQQERSIQSDPKRVTENAPPPSPHLTISSPRPSSCSRSLPPDISSRASPCHFHLCS